MKPIYPEIFTPNNTLQIIDNGDGTISIAEGQKFQIQDVVIDTAGRADLTFPVTAGKTYHLRYSLNGKPINNYTPQPNSFYLVDVTDTNYNPNGVDESDSLFDTKYDDLLVAKVAVDTNGTVAITPLKNKARLIDNFTAYWTITQVISGDPDPSKVNYNIEVPVNWGRKPKVARTGIANEYIHKIQDSAGERYSAVLPAQTSRYVIRAVHGYESLNTTSEAGWLLIYAEA